MKDRSTTNNKHVSDTHAFVRGKDYYGGRNNEQSGYSKKLRQMRLPVIAEQYEIQISDPSYNQLSLKKDSMN